MPEVEINYLVNISLRPLRKAAFKQLWSNKERVLWITKQLRSL